MAGSAPQGLTQRIGVLVELSGADRTGAALQQLGDRSLSAGQRVKAGLSLIGTAAGGLLGGALVKNFANALDLGAANAKLTAQLGLSAPESARIGRVAGKVFADNWGESAYAVGDAVKSVIQNIDGMSKASSVQLQKVTEQAFAVASVGSEDIAKVTAAAGQMLRTGLAKNATEAMDILTVGFQKGVDKSQDLLDTFNEYGTQFRVLGLSGQMAMGLLQQGLKAGARDADVVGDSLKEFAIRSVDGSTKTANGFRMLGLVGSDMAQRIGKGGKSAADALQLTLDKLKNIRDPVLRAQVAVALFGTQSEDMAKALMSLDPSTAVAGLGQVAGAADKAGKALGGDAKTQFQAFIRTLQTGFVDVMGGDVVPILQKVGTVVGAVLVPALGIAATVLGVAAKALGSIPAPALIAAAAVAGITLAINLLGRSAATGAIASFSAWIGRATVGATTLGGRLRGVAAAAAAGTTGAVGSMGVLSGAIGIAVVGLGIYAMFQAQAAQKAADHKSAVDSLAAALKESKGAIDENVLATAAKTLSDAKMFDFGRKIGVSVETMTAAYLGNADAIKTVDAAYAAYMSHHGGGGHNPDVVSAKESKDAWDNLVPSLKDATQANKDQADAVAGTAGATGKATTATKALVDKEAAAAKAAQDEKDALNKLKTALDELNGATVSMVEAESSYQQALDDADAALKKNGATFDQNTQAGRDNVAAALAVEKATLKMAQANIDNGGSIQKSIQIMNDGKKSFIDTAVAMGVPTAQAKALADKIFQIPKEWKTETSVPNYPNTKSELQDIYEKVKNIPPKKGVLINSITAAAEKKLVDMGYHVTHLPDGSVVVSADTSHANSTLAIFLRGARAQHIRIPITSYVQSGSGAGIYVNGKRVGMAYGGLVSGPGTGTSDDIPAPWLSTGEYVMPADVTQDNLPVLEAMRQKKVKLGKGMAAGGVYTPDGPFITAEWVPGTIQAALDKQLSALRITPPPGLGGIFAGSGGAYTGGGALGEWIARAIAWTGVPANWARPLRALVMHESGGDPNAQNNWDRNALAGTPSIGLAQVIGPTFAAYRDPRLPNNLRDPIANLVSALNYIRGHYGDIRHIASYVNDDLFVGGYKEGGIVPRDGFGLLHKGERVQTKAQQRGDTIDYDQLAAAMVRAIRAAGLQIVIDNRVAGRLAGAAVTRLGR